LCLTKRSLKIAGAFTLKNSTVASANFPIIGARRRWEDEKFVAIFALNLPTTLWVVATGLWPVDLF